jgi:hypothetical protein
MPGPYVQVATLCERVLQEADGVLSVIRVIDRIVVTARGPDAPVELPQGRMRLTLVVALKSDDARGRHPVTVRVQQPSGLYLEDQSFDVLFEGEERGVNIIVDVELEAIEGLYWFEVHVNERVLTRVPLRVIYQRVPVGP